MRGAKCLVDGVLLNSFELSLYLSLLYDVEKLDHVHAHKEDHTSPI